MLDTDQIQNVFECDRNTVDMSQQFPEFEFCFLILDKLTYSQILLDIWNIRGYKQRKDCTKSTDNLFLG